MSPEAVLSVTEALHQGEDPIDDATTEEWVPYVTVNDWRDPLDNPVGHRDGPVGRLVRRYVDPRAERIRRLLEDDEYYHAIHRIRQLLDPTKITILLTNVPVAPQYGIAVRLVDVDDLLPRLAARARRVGDAYSIAGDYIERHGFVSVTAVCKEYPDLPRSTVHRAIRQLAADLHLPRLRLVRHHGRGGGQMAFGDAESCRRLMGHLFVIQRSVPGPATIENHEGNDFCPNSVREVSHTVFGQKSVSAIDRDEITHPPPGSVQAPARRTADGATRRQKKEEART